MSEEQSDRPGGRLATLRDRVESGMDRREFVRTLVSGGYALGMARWLGVDDFLAADDGEVPIVTALVREDPSDPFSLTERTTTVPADWYAAVEKAFEVNDLLARVAFTGYLGSAVVPGDPESGTASVSVGVSSDSNSIPEAIREFADDVSIDTESILEIDDIEVGPDAIDAEPRIADGITGTGPPSGFACHTPSSMATLAPALYHPDSGRSFFVTASHAFADDEPSGEPLLLPTQGGETVRLGTVSRIHPLEDVAAVEPSGEYEPTSWIDAPTSVRVRGQLTKYGLAYLAARGEHLEKVGALTGHTTGRIQGVDAVTCFTEQSCRRGQIRWGGEMDLTDGDSGSVSYYPDPEGEPEDVLVAGFNNARTWWPGQSYVWGISAYRLTETQGYHF